MKRGSSRWLAGTTALLIGVAALHAGAAQATPPGANGQIVWQSLTGTHGGGGNEVWIMDANGSNQDAITDNDVHDERPAISADGQKVTFHSYRAGDGAVDSWEIYKMNADGSGQTALTDDDDTDFEPGWAPDGSKIVFMRQSTGVPAGEVVGQDLWTVPVGGGGATNLTNTPLTYECCAEYSPDGSKIAFTNAGDVDNNPMTPSDENEIWVMDANGSNQVKLTDNTAQDVGPTWSPDGTRIAWANVDNGSLWTMDADGSDEAPLTGAATYYAPAWSPDGTLIAAQLGNEIWTVSVSSGVTVTNLTSNGATQDEYPSWAPATGSGAPDTTITKRPDDVIDRRRTRYEFESVPAGADFECKLDDKPYRGCTSPKRLKNLSNGTHRFKVRATTGTATDPTPAKDSFKVKP